MQINANLIHIQTIYSSRKVLSNLRNSATGLTKDARMNKFAFVFIFNLFTDLRKLYVKHFQGK